MPQSSPLLDYSNLRTVNDPRCLSAGYFIVQTLTSLMFALAIPTMILAG